MYTGYWTSSGIAHSQNAKDQIDILYNDYQAPELNSYNVESPCMEYIMYKRSVLEFPQPQFLPDSVVNAPSINAFKSILDAYHWYYQKQTRRD